MYYPQIYFAPIPAPPPQATGQDGEPVGYPPHPQFYPATFLTPYPPQYATPYMMPHPHPHVRPDAAQVPLAPAHPHHYAPYPQAYPKPPSRGPGTEIGAPQMVDGRRDGRIEHARMAESVPGSQAKSV